MPAEITGCGRAHTVRAGASMICDPNILRCMGLARVLLIGIDPRIDAGDEV